jgi:hypothetical protein
MSTPRKVSPKGMMIRDNAIVHDRKIAITTQVWMGIFSRDPTVGRPPCMCDANMTLDVG